MEVGGGGGDRSQMAGAGRNLCSSFAKKCGAARVRSASMMAPMKQNESVAHIMSRDLVTVHRGEPLSKVRKIMNETGVHHVPVVSGEELIGLISWSDILRVSFGDAFNTDERAVDATLDHSMTLEQVMVQDPITLSQDGKIREAAEILAKGDFHSLPVVAGKKLVGMVTTTDLIRYLHDQF